VEPESAETLTEGKGVCTSKANLFVALLRVIDTAEIIDIILLIWNVWCEILLYFALFYSLSKVQGAHRRPPYSPYSLLDLGLHTDNKSGLFELTNFTPPITYTKNFKKRKL